MSEEIKAVAYYRMSSDRQETSIADQRTAVKQFAADNGYHIIREYLDEGISGWKAEQRKGFQQLIADADSGDFQAVLCWDQDRFSRFPVLEANHYWYLLDRAGVHLCTVAQGRLNFEDLGEWLKASVVQHGKAEFIRDLARNTARGLRTRKLAGQWIGGIPFGYRLNSDRRLEFGDPSDVALVRRIFDLRARGYGLHRIAKQLNADEITTPRGSTWHAKSVRAVLLRPAYRGHTVIGLHSRAKYERVAPKPVTIPNTHEPIIDEATWNAVERMPKLGANSRNGSEGAPLSGLLTCGRCGSPMHAATIHRSKYYLCSRYHAGQGCGHCHVERDSLLSAITAKLRAKVLLGSPERLERAIQKRLERRTPAADHSAARRKLATLDRQIERAAARLLTVDDSIVPDLEQSLVELKRRREQLASTVAPATKPQASAKQIAAKIWELDRILCEASPTELRAALRRIISRIVLDFEPAGQTGRGKRYQFAGGMIQLLSQEGKRPSSSPR
jgi:DNA invertase Pin-like site-specific DNA recombinase